MAKLQLTMDQNQALRDEMVRFKEDMVRRESDLEKQRGDFEQWVQAEADRAKDENFLQVVSLYEKQPPKQAKEAFQSLLTQGEVDQVVEYLAAMSSRKAAAVLGEFKAPAEVTQKADLLERLRKRGEYAAGTHADTLEESS